MGGGDSAAVLLAWPDVSKRWRATRWGVLTLVAAVGVRVNTILGRVVAALERAVRAVERVQEVVERGAHDLIADLVETDILRLPDESHGVLQVQVRLAVEVEATSIDVNGAWICFMSDTQVMTRD